MMEDVKWLLKKWGPFFLVLFVAVGIGGIYLGRWSMDERNSPEAVWEPPEEISSNEIEAVITEEEKKQLQSLELSVAEQVKEVYKGVENVEGSSKGGNIRGFTSD